MKKRMFVSALAVLLVLSVALLGGCGKKVKKEKEVPQNSLIEDSQHSTDPNFYDDTVEVLPDENESGTETGGTTASGETSAASGTTVKANSMIVVPVVLNENPGTNTGMVEFSFDANVLTYVDYDRGEIFDNHTVATKDGGKVSILFEMNNDKTGNVIDTNATGRLITLKFKVAKNAKPGSYTIGTVTQFASADSARENELYTPKLKIGKINIK